MWNISQYIAIYGPDILENIGIYWLILRYIGPVDTSPIYSNIFQYMPELIPGRNWSILEYIAIYCTPGLYAAIQQCIPIYSNLSQYSAVFSSIQQYSAVFSSIQQYSLGWILEIRCSSAAANGCAGARWGQRSPPSARSMAHRPTARWRKALCSD